MRHFSPASSLIYACIAVCSAFAQEPITIMQNDLIYGGNIGDPRDGSVEWARKLSTGNGAEIVDLVWDQPFIQSVEFDNLNGVSHNPRGNLLGVNYGPNDGGGSIYNLATCSGLLEGQLIGNTEGVGGDLELSNLGGLSVSPDNSKIAVNGYDTGTLIVFDYQAGNCEATGASLSNARSATVMVEFTTQGTGWLNNDTAIGFTSEAQLVSVDAASMSSTVVASYEDPGKVSVFTDLEYNPSVSPYIYASYGGFGDNETVNRLFVIDPNDSFALVTTADFSESMNTMREIAMDSEGNLYATQFRGAVQLIANADNPTSLTSDSSVDWYEPFAISSFTGLDIAAGVQLAPVDVEGDFNQNGKRDPEDLDLLADGMMANDLAFDLNGDGQTDLADREFWIEMLANTFFGDSDFNGEFNSSDFVAVFESAKYENGTEAHWAEGDWNGDKVFDSSDFVISFQGAGYENGPREGGLLVVPEPSSSPMLLLAAFTIVTAIRKFRIVDARPEFTF